MNTSAKILEVGANGAVVQLPGRTYPGIVMQGDSLSILVSDIEELRKNVAKRDEAEVAASLDTIERHLKERLEFYESVLAKHGIPLPYVHHEKKG